MIYYRYSINGVLDKLNEIWKNLKYIKCCEKYSQYEISSYGRIRSLDVTYPNGKRKMEARKSIRRDCSLAIFLSYFF